MNLSEFQLGLMCGGFVTFGAVWLLVFLALAVIRMAAAADTPKVCRHQASCWAQREGGFDWYCRVCEGEMP